MALHQAGSSGNAAETSTAGSGAADSFRTKRGRCHVSEDALVLESSVVGQFERLYEGNRLVFAGYLLALLVPVAALVTGGRRYVLIGLGIGAAILVVGRVVNRIRGFAIDDRVPLDSIERVVAERGTKGLTRPRFVVQYRRDGETKRRYVMMPSLVLSYGEDAFARAESVFKDHGIDVE